ncbi:unnamed protein product [Cercospora beticola]|nr:unnamed protein product [Cercospora beticola]
MSDMRVYDSRDMSTSQHRYEMTSCFYRSFVYLSMLIPGASSPISDVYAIEAVSHTACCTQIHLLVLPDALTYARSRHRPRQNTAHDTRVARSHAESLFQRPPPRIPANTPAAYEQLRYDSKTAMQ